MAEIERLLVGFDGTPLAEKALVHALTTYPAAEITVVHVIDYIEEGYSGEMVIGSEALRERSHDRSEQLLATAAEIASEYDHEITTAIRVGKPGQEIVEYAEDLDVEMIVIGSHGRSLVARAILGSVAETVIRRASAPVTVVR